MGENMESRYRAEIYERYLSTTYAPRNDLTEEGLQRAADHLVRYFTSYLPVDKDAPILEIGTGSGAFLLCCEQLGYKNIMGVDISSQQVAFCHEKGFDQVVCSDGLGYLRTSTESYVTIAMLDLLEHLSKDEAYNLMHVVYDHLRPGGQALIRVPNLSNPLNLRTRYVDFTHEIGFTKESIQQLLRATGFNINTVHGQFSLHRRWIARVLFDIFLWKAFRLFYRHTMYIGHEVVRGKNLIAVGSKPLEVHSS